MHASISFSSKSPEVVRMGFEINAALKSIIVAKVNVVEVMMLVPMVAPVSVRGIGGVMTHLGAALVPRQRKYSQSCAKPQELPPNRRKRRA
jgi:short subunit dehydrogenase-like uncharacterized protein